MSDNDNDIDNYNNNNSQVSQQIDRDGQFLKLKKWTTARLQLGRVGHALPTSAHLEFQLAHARARDAVWSTWAVEPLLAALRLFEAQSHVLQSQIQNRREYLLNPNAGRRLTHQSCDFLLKLKREHPAESCRFAFVVTNGLSSKAVDEHVEPLLNEILKKEIFWSTEREPLFQLFFIPEARVAIADEVGELIGADLSAIIVGERPGLSSFDSLGIYMTYSPKIGRTDAERNCISNIRPPHGLGYREAADKLSYLISESLQRKLSGVELKDHSSALHLGTSS